MHFGGKEEEINVWDTNQSKEEGLPTDKIDITKGVSEKVQNFMHSLRCITDSGLAFWL